MRYKIISLFVAVLMAAFFVPFCVMAQDSDDANDDAKDLLFEIKVVNIADNDRVVKELSMVYELTSPLGIPSVLQFHVERVVLPSDCEIAKDYLGRDHIEIKDSGAVIYVHPKVKTVQVIHHLMDCTGAQNHVFMELIDVPYTMVLKEENVPDLVDSLIQGVNGRGYVLEKIRVQSYEPVNYKIYDIDGNEITPQAKYPTIYLYYHDQNCPKPTPEATTASTTDPCKGIQEEDAGNSPPVSRLPATGAKDVTAFFMSAVALLGVGIVLTKR